MPTRSYALNGRGGLAARVVLAAALAGAVTGCQGAASAGPGVTPAGSAAATGPAGEPLPEVAPAQVAALVGTWVDVGKGATKDYFVFHPGGSGSWMMGGRTLWTGQLIPAGHGVFRLSWMGGDPQVASSWTVTLSGNGRQLVFQGNQQPYTRGKTPL